MNYELYIPPIIKKKKTTKVQWTSEMLEELIKEFSISYNNELSKKLGISSRTLIRKARELGLEKELGFLDKRRDDISQMARKARKPNKTKGVKGWSVPGSEKTRFKPGNVPAMKTDRKVVEKVRASRNATIARDKIRRKIGLSPLTKLRLKV